MEDLKLGLGERQMLNKQTASVFNQEDSGTERGNCKPSVSTDLLMPDQLPHPPSAHFSPFVYVLFLALFMLS